MSNKSCTGCINNNFTNCCNCERSYPDHYKTEDTEELKSEIRQLQKEVNVLRNQKICNIGCREEMRRLKKAAHE